MTKAQENKIQYNQNETEKFNDNLKLILDNLFSKFNKIKKQ